jgi:uncharacterized protein
MQNGKKHSNAKWTRWVKLTLLVYGSVGIAVYYLQDKVFFHPKPVASHQQYAFAHPFKEVMIPVDDQTSYSLVQFTTASPKGVVLYFHGNQDNVEHYAAHAPAFTKNGYELWMIDYPGFGKSTGTLTEEILYEQALQVYQVARARFSAEHIIIYGRSLGSGIATQLASIRNCRRLVLETPYYSFTSLADRYLWMYPTSRMIKFKMPTYQFLEKVTAPVTVFHGTDDGIIPIENARKLQPLLKPADEFVTIEGGSHNNLGTYPQLKKKLDSLLLAPATPVVTAL